MLRRARIAGVLLALAASVTAASVTAALASGTDATDADSARLIELDGAVGRAIVSGDWATLERLYADDFAFVAPDGRFVARAERLESFRSGRLRYLETSHADLEVHRDGSLAVVTGRSRTRYVASGVEDEGTYRYTSLWRREGETWRLVSTQATKVTAEEPPDGRAQTLAWLAGHWAGVRDGVASEEHWTSPAGGALVGMHKDVRPDGRIFFEFFRIVETDAGELCYLASPGGRPPVSFCAVDVGERRVVFENPAHDFPQRILYWLDERGDLHARVEGPGEGGIVGEEWVWRRRSD
jgi:ketosteroid isomerase-like protein